MADEKQDQQRQDQQKQDQQQTQRLQSLFNKGFAAFERGSLDMAIDLLFQCVKTSPGFLRARKFLRAAATQRYRKTSPSKFSEKLAELAGLPLYLKGRALLKTRKADAALLVGEQLLQKAPFATRFIFLTADAALAAGQPDAAVMTLEGALENAPEDAALLLHLGQIYQQLNDWRKARDCFNRLIGLRPHDGDTLKLLKDAEARMTMESGGWESVRDEGAKDGFRKLIKDKQVASSLDMKNKAVVEGSDADALIAEQRAKIAADPKNLNFHRGLARLLQQQKRFAEAIETLNKACELNPNDPELDRALSALRVQDFNARIAASRDAGEEAAAAEIEGLRNQFIFDDLVARVERYPNDLRLRFELGQQYFGYEAYDDAIQQFQLAQRSPKDRNEALFFLARCFRAKGQRDMAVMQLDTALEQLPIMDDLRKQVLFELGELAEEAGQSDKAFAYFKEIYGSDIGYRDIGEKMERMYKQRKG